MIAQITTPCKVPTSITHSTGSFAFGDLTTAPSTLTRPRRTNVSTCNEHYRRKGYLVDSSAKHQPKTVMISTSEFRSGADQRSNSYSSHITPENTRSVGSSPSPFSTYSDPCFLSTDNPTPPSSGPLLGGNTLSVLSSPISRPAEGLGKSLVSGSTK